MSLSFKPVNILFHCAFVIWALSTLAYADVKVDRIHFASDGSLLDSANKVVKGQGDWSGTPAYSVNDVVQYLGVLYICVAPNTNTPPPSNTSSWSTFAAQGPQGIQGTTGATGANGSQGVQGIQGPAGANGLTGANGVDGKSLWSGTADPLVATGADGDFYINTTSNNIFGPKAAGTWPAGVSLVGPSGSTGPQGPIGLTGSAGPQGIAGATGSQGPTGLTGAKGATGPQGPAGTNYTLPRSPVLATGQQVSYADSDDGNWKSGVVISTTRFTDNGKGTMTDNLTGLIWLKNANCFGMQNWVTALASANALASGACGLTDGSTPGQWRLPNRTELMSLVDHAFVSPSLPNGHPFTSVQPNFYWSSSTSSSDPASAWYVDLNISVVKFNNKTNSYYVWLVRSGQ